MSDWSYEPTIGEIMREPAVRALMRADRVNVREFETRLRLMAGDADHPDEADADAEDDVSFRRLLPRLMPVAAERCCAC